VDYVRKKMLSSILGCSDPTRKPRKNNLIQGTVNKVLLRGLSDLEAESPEKCHPWAGAGQGEIHCSHPHTCEQIDHYIQMLSIEVELVLPLVCCISPPEYNTLCHFEHAQVALMDEGCYRFQTYVNRL
jgi:hypothetical protein